MRPLCALCTEATYTAQRPLFGQFLSGWSIFTRLNGRIGTSYDGERHYVPNLADAPHRRPTRPLFTKVRGIEILGSSAQPRLYVAGFLCRVLEMRSPVYIRHC